MGYPRFCEIHLEIAILADFLQDWNAYIRTDAGCHKTENWGFDQVLVRPAGACMAGWVPVPAEVLVLAQEELDTGAKCMLETCVRSNRARCLSAGSLPPCSRASVQTLHAEPACL